MQEPVFFATSEDLFYWFEENQGKSDELWVGFHKRGTGKRGITYREAADEALCFGWAEAIRKSLSEGAYMIRFVPRRPDSVWSASTVERFGQLAKEGRMQPSGYEAFRHYDPDKVNQSSYDNRPHELPEAYERIFRENPDAWAHFQSRPPSYRRTCISWVMQAKQEATRERRLQTLIADSAAGRTIKPLDSKGGPAK